MSPDELITAAVVPLYNPEPAVAGRLEEIAKQVSFVIAVDDGSTSPLVDGLHLANSFDVTLISSERNEGVAIALNTGILRALERHADVILTIDQDSRLSACYVQQAIAGLREANRLTGGCVGVLAAGKINGLVITGRPVGQSRFRSVAETIQSGMVIPSTVFREHGLFDASLVIDCVDTEFSLRLSSNGLRTIVDPSCEMEHTLGERRQVRRFGRLLSRPGHHNPVRRYYIARNRLVVLLRYGQRYPRWAVIQTKQQLSSLVNDLFYGDEATKILIATAAGFVHAIIGRSGSIPNPLRRLLVGDSGFRALGSDRARR